jgi:hypothetical protein
MASIRNEVQVRAPAADVWAAVRDFGAVHTRVVPGFLTDCKLEGDTRVVTFANGMVARESLVAADDGRRRLVYAIVGQRFAHYNGTVEVRERAGGGSTIVWVIDMLPDEMAAPVRGLAAEGAAAMARTFGDPR